MIRPEEPFKFPISAEKPFEYPISAEKSVTTSDKPFESDSRAMKIWVKVAYSCLTLSKKPPLFEILATRLKRRNIKFYKFYKFEVTSRIQTLNF